jgi:hypothetical protein
VGAVNIIDDDYSSKGSYGGGGASVVAAVEGFSESGSDADVSDSFEVPLGVDKRGEKGRQLDGSLGREISVQEMESESIYNVSGNYGELGKSRAKGDVDKGGYVDKGGKAICVESAGVSKRVGNDVVKSPSRSKGLVDNDSVLLVENEETEVEGTCVNTTGDVGPVIDPQNNTQEGDVEKGGCVEKEVRRQEPVWVRTKMGDLLINGPCDLGPNMPYVDQQGEDEEVAHNSSDSIESYGNEPCLEGGAKINPTHGQQRGIKHHKKGKKKKQNPNRNLPNLPFNILRKLPGALPNKRKGGSKQAGEVSRPVGEGILVTNNSAENGGEFELEIVLPFNSECEGQIPILQPVEHSVAAGTDGFGVSVPREMYEAEKLVEIGAEMGINFQGNEGEDVAKMIAMEDRDRMEKEDWESKKVDQ